MENLSDVLKERRKIQIQFHLYEVSKQAELNVVTDMRLEVDSGGMRNILK